MPYSTQSSTNTIGSGANGHYRLLIVEDSMTDYELMVRELRKSDHAFDTRRAASESAILTELREFSPHLVCTDYRLPGITGLDVILMVAEHSPLIPVIVVTGTLTEEDAADSIKAGATDYVVKERLFRLVPAIRNALEKRREKEELQDTQRRFEHSESRALALLNATSDAVALLDAAGIVLEANQPCAEFLGQPLGGLLGRCAWDLMPGDQAAECRELVARVFADGKPVRAESQHGHTWLDLTVHPVRSPDGTVGRVALFRRDITQPKRDQAELERLGTAVAQADEAFIITDADGIILYVNPAFSAISGYSGEEAIGQRPSFLRSGKHDRAFYDTLWRTIRSGKTWQGRFTNRRKDGSLFQEDATVSPILDPQGIVTNYVAVSHDVTKQVELESQMVRQERMQALGKMVSGIAHDFNNILVPILGLAEEMLSSPETITQPECVRACLSQIVASAGDARDIVRRLREFYRPGDEVERAPVDLAEVVAGAVTLTRPAWQTQAQAVGKTITVRNEVRSLPAALGNAAQLRELFVNLLLNSVDAIQEAGEITIQAQVKGPRILATVRDTGCGMDESQLARCMEPFFSTKGERGSGLGLAMCYGIVKQHGGSLHIDSAPGKGTTVEVVLPICREAKPPAEAPARGATVGALRILVLDDEPMATKVMQKLLQRLGHTVTTAQSGEQALAELARGGYQILLTDRAMPGMSGDEVAARAKEDHPDLPVIMLTGFGDLMDYASETPPGVDLVIGKPASLRNLSDAIDQVLG